MKWTVKYTINNHDTDFNNIVSASGIMRYMQDAANFQMEGQKPSYDELFNSGRAFVLSRFRMSLYSLLHSHDKIEASTWAVESKGVSFDRCFSITKNGLTVAEATSVWALVDRNTGRLVRVSDFENNYSTDEPVELDLPARFRLPSDLNFALVGERTVEYRDVDINRHINNTRYPDILCGYIPHMEGKRVINLEINYLSEAPIGETLKVYMAKSDGSYYFKTIRENGKTNIEAEIMIDDI